MILKAPLEELVPAEKVEQTMQTLFLLSIKELRVLLVDYS
jgi:hypothetical protein